MKAESNQTPNVACRIFKEQINLINQLPEQDRANVLYLSIMNAFNQFENQNDNQIENQNEYAYISISTSLSKSIIELLSKNIVFKEYNNNYGGKREFSGRKSKKSKESKESKISETTNININLKHKLKTETLNKYGELGNVCLTEQDYLRLSKENPLFLDAVEKLDSWLDTKGGEKNKGRNHRAYFKSNSWVWENLRPKQTSFLDEMREKRNRELGL